MNTIKKTAENILDFLKNDPGLFSLLRPGDLVKGHVLEKASGRVFVDLGKHGTWVVYRNETENAREIVRGLKVGDEVNAKVQAVDNDEGLTELSLSQADKQKSWNEVQELKEKEEILVVRSVKFNRGGFIFDVNGVPAFLPISQLSPEHYSLVMSEDKNQSTEAMQKLVGEEFKVKITDLNSRTSKFIVSERAALEVSVKELAKNYEVGQEIDGIVSGVADFGAFVRFTDNPAVEGLIHVSELDWREIKNPKEIINVDDAVKAKIIDIKDGKISLSLKALKTNPWEDIPKKYKEGAEVSGHVYSFNPFGAIVDLGHGFQGQIHVTEFGGVEEMKKELTLGKEYQFTIQSVQPEEKRIVLKLKK